MKAALLFTSVLWIMAANVANSSPGQNEPCFCTEEYAPVCGEIDGAICTYGNRCQFKCIGGRDEDIVFNGTCEAYAHYKTCVRKCPNYFYEVCGSDGITYPGDCYVECHRKFERGKENLCVVGPGSCD